MPRSVTWNDSSRMIAPPFGLSAVTCEGFLQYHLSLSMDLLGLTRSMTTPIVSANLTGLWGVFGGSKNMEPSSMIMSLNSPLSTTLRHMDPWWSGISQCS